MQEERKNHAIFQLTKATYIWVVINYWWGSDSLNVCNKNSQIILANLLLQQCVQHWIIWGFCSMSAGLKYARLQTIHHLEYC